MARLGLALWCNWLHAIDLLEAKVIPNKSSVSCWLYWFRGILGFGYCFLLPIEDCPPGGPFDSRYIRRTYHLCLSNQVRLYIMDAILVRWALGFDPFRVHGGILSIKQHR